MVWQTYSSHSYLYFNGEDVILSREGIQQGDGLGSFLFSLGIMDLVSSCSSEFSAWYLDDGTVAGHPSAVYEDLSKINNAAESLV